ncbi:MAG: hypothetical protein ACXAD7_05170, partial [Candidatus Kariarchaeaceae archaeon]
MQQMPIRSKNSSGLFWFSFACFVISLFIPMIQITYFDFYQFERTTLNAFELVDPLVSMFLLANLIFFGYLISQVNVKGLELKNKFYITLGLFVVIIIFFVQALDNIRNAREGSDIYDEYDLLLADIETASFTIGFYLYLFAILFQLVAIVGIRDPNKVRSRPRAQPYQYQQSQQQYPPPQYSNQQSQIS